MHPSNMNQVDFVKECIALTKNQAAAAPMQLKDYLQYYLGCKVKDLEGGGEYFLDSVDREGNAGFADDSGIKWELKYWRLQLHAVEDMPPAEQRTMLDMPIDRYYMGKFTKAMLKGYYDIFGLIEKDLADKIPVTTKF